MGRLCAVTLIQANSRTTPNRVQESTQLRSLDSEEVYLNKAVRALTLFAFALVLGTYLTAGAHAQEKSSANARRGLMVTVTGGDCFLLAPRSSFVLRDNPRTRPKSFCEVAPKAPSNVFHYGGGGAPTTIISGLLSFDAVSLKPITQLLPSLILVKADQARTLALHTTLQLLASEMAEQAPGSEVAANRLAEVLFIQTLRAHIASGSVDCKRGRLRAIFEA